MKLFQLFTFTALIISLYSCKKENQTTSCLDESQKNSLVQSLAYLSHDSTQMSAAERQLMNDIRIIANDIDAISNGVDTTIAPQDYYNIVRTNFLHHVDIVTQKATIFYNGSEPKVILAKNAFVLMSYDALQRKYPEFMWTQLGVFAANEVRSGLVLALFARYTLKRNNIQIPLGNIDAAEAMLQSSKILIQGQIDVLTDIGSFGILNKNLGAAAMKKEIWLTTEAKKGFELQEQAETALKTGDCSTFYDVQTEAAIQFGAHEQIYILQPMWNQPLMQQFAALDQLLIQLSNQKFVFFGDIFVGTNKNMEANKGYIIKIPANATNLANAQQRVQIAMNGFNTINELRKNSTGSHWIAYSQVKIGYAYDTYNAVVE